MGAIDFNLQKYDGEFKAVGIKRVLAAAEAIRDMAKAKCKEGTITRMPGRKRFKGPYGMEPSTNPPIWMERSPGAMKKTIRVWPPQVTENTRDIRVYAGNFKTWWAVQMEYGRGRWKGGAKPFLRPALHGSESKVRSIIEGR
jgi:hypothetical protein